jgi:hypothetical protein
MPLMDVEITPEPSEEERAAILAALAEDEEAEGIAEIEDPLPVDNP